MVDQASDNKQTLSLVERLSSSLCNEDTMQTWDGIRKLLLEGCLGSLPRDIFEGLLEVFDEDRHEAAIRIAFLESKLSTMEHHGTYSIAADRLETEIKAFEERTLNGEPVDTSALLAAGKGAVASLREPSAPQFAPQPVLPIDAAKIARDFGEADIRGNTDFIRGAAYASEWIACEIEEKLHDAEPPTVTPDLIELAFEIGFCWRSQLIGQTLEDSRAVGRTLSSYLFDDLPVDTEGLSSFETADQGIVAAKKRIKQALRDKAKTGVVPDDVETSDLQDAIQTQTRDWTDVAKLAGKLGITYPTNAAMEDFLLGLSSTGSMTLPSSGMSIQQSPLIQGTGYLEMAENICTAAALRQWEQSLKRPDLDEASRVRGAIEAYKRQAFALSLTSGSVDSYHLVKPLVEHRFKLSFNKARNCDSLRNFAEELEGKWVWLIAATDGKNSPLFTTDP